MGLTRTTDATTEPVSRDDLKAHLYIDDNDHDGWLDDTEKAARNYVERFCRRQLVNATWTLTLDSFADPIKVPRPPLGSVTKINYIDTSGSTQTVSTSTYTVITDREPGELVQSYGQTWPTPRAQPEAVTVTYVAGYGSAATHVPEMIRHGIKLLVGNWFEHRESVVVGSVSKQLEQSLTAILWQYRVQDWNW